MQLGIFNEVQQFDFLGHRTERGGGERGSMPPTVESEGGMAYYGLPLLPFRAESREVLYTNFSRHFTEKQAILKTGPGFFLLTSLMWSVCMW